MKTYKSFGVWLVFFLASLSAKAQFDPYFTNYQFDPFTVNPAFASQTQCNVLSFGVRSQWGNVDNPIASTYFQAYTILNKDKRKQQNGVHGVGLQVYDNLNGNFRQQRIAAAYAYQLQIGRKSNLSFGAQVAYKRLAFDNASLFIRDPNDPLLEESWAENIFPEFSMGIWYAGENDYLGFSWINMNKRTIIDGSDFVGMGEETTIPPSMYLYYGRQFSINNYYRFVPSGMLVYNWNHPPRLDLNATYHWGNEFSLGMGYRVGVALTAQATIRLGGNFDLGYAYDFNTSRLRPDVKNSHEILLKYSPCNSKAPFDTRFYCPAY